MTDLFDIRLWLYPGANPSSDPSLWGLEADISSYIRHPGNDGGQVISYSGGRGDEAAGTDAGEMRLTLDNRDGRFSTDNLAGAYSGLLDLNTPIRMGVAGWKDDFNRSGSSGWGTVSSTLGQAWTVSGTASNWSTDGARGQLIIPTTAVDRIALAGEGSARDCDIVMTVVPAATATGGAYGAGPIMRYSDSSNMVYGTIEFNTSGTITLKIRRALGAPGVELAESNPVPSSSYSANDVWRVRMQSDGNQLRLKAWLASGTEPSTWNLTCTEDSLTGTATGVYLARFAGNTNSAVASIMGIDNFTITTFEFTGSVVSWPLRWNKTSSNSWAPITAAGILRRLTQGSNPTQSPLRRQLSGTANVAGYWPFEDGASATFFTSALPGKSPATFNANAVTPAADTTLLGGGPAPTFSTASGLINGRVAKGNGGNGLAAMFFFKLSSLPGSKTRIARFRTSRGPVPIWDLSIDSTNIYTEGISGDGVVVTSDTDALWAIDFTNWVAWQFKTGISGGNTTWSSVTHEVGDTSYFTQSGSVAGATTSVIASFDLTGPSGTSFAHVWLGENTLPFVTDTFSLVSSGYAGELAADRFARVCGEVGIPYVIHSGTGDSEAMGPQREGTTMAILKACVDAEYGVLAERGAGLEFIPRSARWNPDNGVAVTLALDIASGHIDSEPQPVRDDQRLRNRWTVNRVGGGTGTAQDDDSVDRNGLWEDSATINVMDDTVLDNHAGFRVAVGISRALRWPQISINFARNRTLLSKWRARGYPLRITVANTLTQLTGSKIDLIMEGFTCQLWPNGWQVTMNASNAGAWHAAVADNTGIWGRVDIDGCTTTALISATATSIPVTTASPYPKWDNTSGLWSGGVDLNVGGERITVNALANNSSPAQTFTVTARGVDGYSAIHASGTEVSLWFPAIVAL